MEEDNEMLRDMEMVSDLERNMMNLIQSQEISPEIMRVVRETYGKVEDIFRKYNSNPQNALDYAMENSAYIKQTVKRVHHKNMQEKLQGVKLLCKGIEKSLEDKQENQDERVKGYIGQIASSNNLQDGERINENIEEWIKDSLSRANRILASRGASQRTIDAQTDEVRNLIRRTSPRNRDRIVEALKEGDVQLLNSLLQRYEDYENEVKSDKMKKQDRSEFVNELKEGAPTPEEQADVARKREENIENGEAKLQEPKSPSEMFIE